MKIATAKLSLLCLSLLFFVSCGTKTTQTQREADFNFDWKFTELKDTVTLTSLPLDDASWRDIRLPHDWSVEHSFDKDLEGCTGYLPGGVAVYQKHFITDEDVAKKSIFVLFDGVYNNAKFWLNGQLLGENPYGYSPVYFDLTDALKPKGEENVLSVYVNHSHYADSRWYTGSGIYRNVKLVTVDKLHIPIWGTFLTTPNIKGISSDGKTAKSANVEIQVSVVNQNKVKNDFTMETSIFDKDGKVVAENSLDLSLEASKEETFKQSLSLEGVDLWNVETPTMYKAVTSIKMNDKVLDAYTTPFGVRQLVMDKDKGFFVNGVNTLLRGVCLHHDGGLVGTAVPKEVWRRRIQALKDGGVNSIRTSHNPFSEEFLSLCDEMGILVQNEIFDEWDNPKDKRFNFGEKEPLYRTEGYDNYFQQWAEDDLKRVVRRDRNHPCVYQWSIGNEIEWTYPEYKHVSGLFDKGMGGYWNAIPKLTPEQMKERYDALPPQQYVLTKTAEKLVKWVKEVDTTRTVTSNCIIPVASCVTGYADALDVVSVSYQIAQYDWMKKHFPHMMFTGGENSGLFQEWKSVTDNPMVYSMFMWTGIDYMGESNGRWPQKAWPGDMLDIAGFKRTGWNHFKAIWANEPFLALQTHRAKDSGFEFQNGEFLSNKKKWANWNNSLSQDLWNYEDNELTIVEIVTNQPEAELFLNGKSLGKKKLSECPDNIMRWAVPYVAGTLEAKTNVDGKTMSKVLKTAGAPSSMDVQVDKKEIAGDGYDLVHVVVQLMDKDGQMVKTENREISFELTGDVKLLGVDNGDNKSVQDYQTDKVTTHLGRCLAIVQSKKGAKGEFTITVKAEGLDAKTATVKLK